MSRGPYEGLSRRVLLVPAVRLHGCVVAGRPVSSRHVSKLIPIT